ncbi:hypothetical protein D3C72_721470 [compost metagenome]
MDFAGQIGRIGVRIGHLQIILQQHHFLIRSLPFRRYFLSKLSHTFGEIRIQLNIFSLESVTIELIIACTTELLQRNNRHLGDYFVNGRISGILRILGKAIPLD